MEKMPNNTQMIERSDVGDVEFDDRIFRIMIGVVGLISVTMAIMMLIAGAIGFWALINWMLSVV